MNPITDLHCHPSAKALFTTHNTKGNRAWKTYFYRAKILFLKNGDEIFGDFLDSQSSLTQVSDGDGKLIFWTLYPFEKEYIQKKLIAKFIARLESKNDVLMSYYKFANHKLRSRINYYGILKDHEYDIVIHTSDINILTHTKRSLQNQGIINVAMNIEGAHAFLDGTESIWDINATNYLNRMDQMFAQNEIFYFTPAHIAPNGIFNHAYAGKLLKHKEMSKFFPRVIGQDGISNLGFQIIDKCIEKGVNIDVKHMSYRARMTLYDELDQRKANHQPCIAPIASHMGVFGGSIADFFGRMDTSKGHFPSYKFEEEDGTEHYFIDCLLHHKENDISSFHKPIQTHARTISLFDEDIRRIVHLDGFIGVILDQRVLGWGHGTHENDVFTLEDFVWLCQQTGNPHFDYIDMNLINVRNNAVSLNAKSWTEKDRKVKWKDKNGLRQSKRNTLHIQQFCFNVIHILHVIQQMGVPEPWKFIGLGSDYDGLINPVNCCVDSKDIPKFRGWVKEYLEDLGDFQSRFGISVHDFLEGFFYKNVLNFYGIR